MDSHEVEAAVGGIAGLAALVGQFRVWWRAWQQASALRAKQETGVEIARLGGEDRANERLFASFSRQIEECQKRLDESEKDREQLNVRVAELRGHVIRLQASLEVWGTALDRAGVPRPAVPIVDVTGLRDR